MNQVSHNGAHDGAPQEHGAKAVQPSKPTALRVRFENIPDQLTSINQWVLWRYELVADWKAKVAKAESPWTKVPYQPDERKAASTRATTWSNFDEVRAAYGRGGFDGVGFVLTSNTGIIGVDMDKQRADDGAWSDEVNAQIVPLRTYGEVSPSGRGVRFFGFGTLPPTGRKRGNFEMYNSGRFLTVTGHQLDSAPDTVNECGAALLDFHTRYIAPATSPRPIASPSNLPLDLDDTALLDKARAAKNGAKFIALYDDGDTSAYGADHSAADAALCSMLRYWTRADAARMDAMFRRSNLMREKWDTLRGSETYGQITIANAIAQGGEVYDPERNGTSGKRAASKSKEQGAQTRDDAQSDPKATTPTKVQSPDEIRAAFKSAASQVAPPIALDELIARFRKWMFVKDDGLIKVTLAAFAANLSDGDPVWLMIVGGSSSGKTETVSPLSALPFARLVGTLTESSFLSGSSKRDKAKDASGGLLRELGSFGVLLMKDFTSILSIHHDKRISVLAALREIYDGSWTRDIGNDGGRKLEWRGKIGIIACCTDAIESAHAVSGAMGERFMRYRLQHDDDDQKAMTRHALRRVGRDAQMRAELEQGVAGFFGALDITAVPAALSEEEEDRLIAIAMLTAKSRSVVDRDAKTRDIELTHDAEIPTRLATMLRRVLHGLQSIGVSKSEAWAIVQKVALDSIPKLRAEIIRLLAQEHEQKSPYPLTAKAIEKALKTSGQATRRALEELRAHSILADEDTLHAGNKVARWTFSELGAALWEEGFSASPPTD